MKDYGDTNFITGMRAYAALAVVLIHSGGGGLRALPGEIGDKIANLGLAGVYVFFVISGFSVASSYTTSGGFWHYINKRIWRLLPLYYFWLLMAVFLGTGSARGVALDSYNLLMHLFFLGFLDYDITNSIIGVEWTISIEMFWYFLVPWILLLVPAKKLAVVGSVVFSVIAYLLAHKLFGFLMPDEKTLSVFLFSPIPYVMSYCFGVAAFRLRSLSPNLRRYGNKAFIALLMLFLAFLIRPSGSHHVVFLFFSLLTFALLVFGASESALFRWVFENRPVIWLGTVSYGIYLSHLPLMGVLPLLGVTDPFGQFVMALGAATVVSTVTYYLIELPGQTFGKMMRSIPGQFILARK